MSNQRQDLAAMSCLTLSIARGLYAKRVSPYGRPPSSANLRSTVKDRLTRSNSSFLPHPRNGDDVSDDDPRALVNLYAGWHTGNVVSYHDSRDRLR